MNKCFMTMILLCLLAPHIYGATEEEETDPCQTMMLFQPQANGIVEAASVFNVYTIRSACLAKDKIKLNSSEEMRLISFSHTTEGDKFEYSITTFGKGTLVTKRICKIGSHYEYQQEPGSVFISPVEVFSNPECGEDVVTQH